MPKFISYSAKILTINELQQYFCQLSTGGTHEKKSCLCKAAAWGFFGGVRECSLFYICTQ